MMARSGATQQGWHPTRTRNVVEHNALPSHPHKIRGRGVGPADVCQVSFFLAKCLLDNGFEFAGVLESRCVATDLMHMGRVAQQISCTRNRMYHNGFGA